MPILSYGPFTFIGRCRDEGATSFITFSLTSTEAGHVSTSSTSPDDFAANETQPLNPIASVSANNTTVGGGHALTTSGRFISLGIFTVAKTGGADCVFQASGWGG